MGGVYDGIGELRNAMDYYQRALQISQEVKDRTGEGRIFNNIGQLYDKLAEPQKALDLYERSLSLSRLVKDRRTEAITLNNIGYLHASFGDLGKAFSYFEQAKSIKDYAYNPLDYASTLANVGHIFASNKDFQKAQDYYQQALAIQMERGNDWAIAYTLISIGQLQASSGKWDEGLKSYEQAFNIFEKIEDKQGLASALEKLAEIFVLMNQSQKALNHYNKALQLWREIGDRRGEATTLYGLARLERDRGNISEALKNSEAAINIIESLRSKVGGQQLRLIYLASVHDYYDLNIDMRMRLHKAGSPEDHQALALNACERSRARGLLELLNEMHVEINQKVDAQLLEREHLLRHEINEKEQASIQLLKSKHTPQMAAASEKELSELIERYQDLLAEIKMKNPSYAELTQPEPLTLKEIQQQVLDPDTMLLEYALGDERSYLWAVTQDSISSFELPSRKEIEAQAISVYEMLTARQSVEGTSKQYQQRIARADAGYWPQAARLSQMLLGPVALQLGTKRLLVVTEGALQYIPFSALPVPVNATTGRNDEKYSLSVVPRPLIIDHEIVKLPSASVLAILRREFAERKPAAKAVAVLADPVFDKDDYRIKSSKNLTGQSAKSTSSVELDRGLRDAVATRDGLNLQRLKSSREEAAAILKVSPARDSFEALDFKATREMAMSPELGQYRIVHFATHGVLDNKHPELSGIVFSLVNEKGESQNGFLRLHNIYNLNLPAELVVLSACSTGLGKEFRGEGVVGLTRGFMYAGAARVVASLWKVRDRSTARFMEKFYREMMIKKSPAAAALRAAQIEMFNHAAFKAPYFWAAFVLQGEWK
jgi:CHAT domain-containing protein/Tfp pilus assembly protein PilF